MNEQTLNTLTVQGDEHVGGFVLVKRISDVCWQAEEWSAYFAKLVLPENCGRFYLEDGRIVAEFSANDIYTLSQRLEAVCLEFHVMLIFGVPENLRIPEKALEKWRKDLERI